MNNTIENNNQYKGIIKEYSKLFAVFIVLCLILEMVLVRKSLFDTGDGFQQQFIYFVQDGRWIRELFKNIFVRHIFELPMWDMSIGMGDDSLITYFGGSILDPFVWLSAITPLEVIEYVFDIVVISKMYLSGLTFICLGIRKTHSREGILTGAMIYVFSSILFIGLFQHNFLNFFILFPLLLVGVDRLWKRSYDIFYILVLFEFASLSLYFTYVMGLLVVFYCAIRFFCDRSNRSVRTLLRLLLRFILNSAIAIGMSGLFSLPSAYRLTHLNRVSSYGTSFFYTPKELWDFASAHIFNAFSYWYDGSTVLWGFNAFAVVGLIILFGLKDRKFKPLRIMFVLFVGSMLFPGIASFFNGMNYASYRYTFGLILLIAYIVTATYEYYRDFKGKVWYISLGVSAVYILLGCFFSDLGGIISGISLLMTVGCIGLINTKESSSDKHRKYYRAILLFGAFITCSLCVLYMQNIAVDFGTAYTSMYSRSVKPYISEQELEKNRCNYIYASYLDMINNSSMVLDVMSYDYYHSSSNQYMNDYYDSMAILGDPRDYNLSGSRGRLVPDLLNGTKYILRNESYPFCVNVPYEYARSSGDENNTIYQSDTETSLVYYYDEAIGTPADDILPFDLEDIMLDKVILSERAGLETSTNSLYDEVDYRILEVNNVIADDNSFHVDDCGYITLGFDAVDHSELYLYFSSIEGDSNAELESYQITTCPMCGEGAYCEEYYLGRSNSVYLSKSSQIVFGFGYIENSVDNIRIYFDTPGDYRIDQIQIFARSAEQLNECKELFYKHADIASADYQISGNSVSVSSVSDHDRYLYLAIPYSDGWRACVDGEETEILRANYAFMAIPVKAGEHNIELKYTTPYLFESFCVSMVSLTVFIGASVIDKKRSRI